MSYADFLAGKSQYGSDNGFSYVETPMSPSASLFGFQHELVEWACRLGRAAMSRLIVVGPREHVFHCRPATEVYADFAAFMAHEMLVRAREETSK